MSNDFDSKAPPLSQHDLWMGNLKKLGGQFWPPKKEDIMPQVGAKFPMMLYKQDNPEMVVYDEEELRQGKERGWHEAHSTEPPAEAPQPQEEPKKHKNEDHKEHKKKEK